MGLRAPAQGRTLSAGCRKLHLASARLGPSPPSTLAGWPHRTSTARPTEPHRGKAAEPQRPGPRGGCSPASPRAILVSPSSVRLRLLGPRGPTVPVAGASGSHNRAWPLLQGHSRLQTNLEVCHCPRSGDLRRVPQTSAGPGAKANPAHSPRCPATALKQQMALALVTTAPTPGHPPRALPKTLQGTGGDRMRGRSARPPPATAWSSVH